MLGGRAAGAVTPDLPGAGWGQAGGGGGGGDAYAWETGAAIVVGATWCAGDTAAPLCTCGYETAAGAYCAPRWWFVGSKQKDKPAWLHLGVAINSGFECRRCVSVGLRSSIGLSGAV